MPHHELTIHSMRACPAWTHNLARTRASLICCTRHSLPLVPVVAAVPVPRRPLARQQPFGSAVRPQRRNLRLRDGGDGGGSLGSGGTESGGIGARVGGCVGGVGEVVGECSFYISAPPPSAPPAPPSAAAGRIPPCRPLPRPRCPAPRCRPPPARRPPRRLVERARSRVACEGRHTVLLGYYVTM